jgi:hypothetical protein
MRTFHKVVTMSPLERRKWVPDIKMIADQLIEDYRNSTWSVEGLSPDRVIYEGENDSLSTLVSWINTAHDHDEEFQEDDWIALAQELAKRVVFGEDDRN